ncbi:MAG: T9SS type A sorting domain-containing protein [Bacteroidetes bacterium]|nr:T9SS type A sorting domain-containing protein [Bacteroidota bacterium]
MQRIFILFLILFCCVCKSQTVQSSCNAHDSILKKYKSDAHKLNYRRVYHINSTYKDSISFNKTITNTYLNALVAVYNATALPAVDTVLNIFNIHAYNPIVNAVLIKADSNLLWMKNIRANITPVGNSTVDSLMNKYYLKKDYYFAGLSPNATLVLKTDSNCNISALARKFQSVQGVTQADSSFYAGDNNNIIDSITSTFTWLVYSYGWGDCPNGCSFKRYWGFKVYNDCSVEYTGSYGTSLTVGIKEVLNSFSKSRAYPNPFKDQLTIQLPINSSKDKVTLKITNTLGRTILQNDFSDKESFVLNTSVFPDGIYILTTYLNNSIYSIQKIIKH